MHPPQQQPQHWQQPPYRPPTPPRRRKSNGWKWLLAAVAGIVLLVVCLVVASVATAPHVTLATPTRQAEPDAAGGVPSPSKAQQRAYLTALERIDPGLVVNEDRAIRRARSICDRVINGAQGATLEKYVVAELSGGNATINEAQAKQVIKAVKVWCRP